MELCFEKQAINTHFSANSDRERVLHTQLLGGTPWALPPDWKSRNGIEGLTLSANAYSEGAVKADLGSSVARIPATGLGRAGEAG